MVFWDKIIRQQDNRRLSISNLKSKYPIADIEDKLPGKEAIIRLYWGTVPHVGYLFDTQRGEVTIKVPNVGEKYVRT